MMIEAFFTKLKENYEGLLHLLYLPDYYLFRHLDNFLQRKVFTNCESSKNVFKNF